MENEDVNGTAMKNNIVLDFLVVDVQKSKVFYCKEDIHMVTANFDIDSVCRKSYCRL